MCVLGRVLEGVGSVLMVVSGVFWGVLKWHFRLARNVFFKSSPSVNQRLGLSTRVFSTSRIMGICELGKLGVARGKLETQKKHSWRYGRM